MHFNELLIIFLELYTLRNYRKFSSEVCNIGREIITRNIGSDIDYKDFRHNVACDYIYCDHPVFIFISGFLKYLKRFDKFLSI